VPLIAPAFWLNSWPVVESVVCRPVASPPLTVIVPELVKASAARSVVVFVSSVPPPPLAIVAKLMARVPPAPASVRTVPPLVSVPPAMALSAAAVLVSCTVAPLRTAAMPSFSVTVAGSSSVRLPETSSWPVPVTRRPATVSALVRLTLPPGMQTLSSGSGRPSPPVSTAPPSKVQLASVQLPSPPSQLTSQSWIGATSVVKVTWSPLPVPASLLATSWAQYSVCGTRPPRFTVTLCGELLVCARLWGVVTSRAEPLAPPLWHHAEVMGP
jgi:hypothetical protein